MLFENKNAAIMLVDRQTHDPVTRVNGVGVQNHVSTRIKVYNVVPFNTARLDNLELYEVRNE